MFFYKKYGIILIYYINKGEVIVHKVKCKYCGKTFDRDTTACVKEGNRYSHKECVEQLGREELELQELENYIMNLFDIPYITPKIRRQIDDYYSNYKFSYSGMQKALIYFYEIKKGPLEKANGGIGILPYIYKDAYDYYFSIWQAHQKNSNKDIGKILQGSQKTISIFSPKRPKKKQRKLFSFLDKEED